MYPFKTWTDRAEHHVFDWHGKRMPYCTLGEGPPIVLMHGLGLSYEEWEKNVDTLTRYGKVYAPDMPGFGHSDEPGRVLTCRELAEAAIEWAEGIGLPPAVWLGHSNGGEVALWVAGLAPARVRAVVLAGSTSLPPRPGVPGRLWGLLRDSYRESPAYLLRLTVSYLQAGPWRVLKTVLISEAESLLRLTGRITMPVLVLHGRRDPIVPLYESRMTARRLLDGRLRLLDAPHAMNFSAAEVFNQALSEFLGEILGPANPSLPTPQGLAPGAAMKAS